MLQFKLVFILFFNLITFFLKAQDTVKTSLIIFDQDDISAVTNKDGEDKSYPKNALKFNPLLLVRGEIPIYYERAINDYFSIEVAIGMTYKDYVSGIFDKNNFSGESVKEEISSNISYKLGLRFYTGGVVMDGFYFALEYAKRDYSKSINFSSYNYITDPLTYNTTTTKVDYKFNEYYYHNEYKIIVGSQEHYYWDNFFIDYYVGAGIDKYTKSEVTNEINQISNSPEYKNNIESSTAPRFYLGLKFGFVF
ncbi:MAG TPA: hypothetical protein PK649_02570 [Vicingus sp.]|nr:hypothetical protein [Vicingus sp.]HRP59097.1 hypothetical protein [Vicingus sp.]